MTTNLALCLWGLPESPASATAFANSTGFDSVDVRPGYLEVSASDRVLPLSCMAVAHLMPEGAALDDVHSEARQLAIAHVHQGIREAEQLGIPDVYVGPPSSDASGSMAAYRESILVLADQSSRAGVRLGIEHFPGRGLPTVRATLDFISNVGHQNLYLLLDIGHNQIARESPRASILAAGDRLMYVHVNDNDGQNDTHVGLLEGVQEESWLRDAVLAVKESAYAGPISVEVNQGIPDPRASARESLAILRRLE